VIASGNGGGIRAGVAGASLTIVNSAVSSNQAGGNGGGIYAGAGVNLTISGSTISGNTASLSPNGGGGISSAQALTITDSTISNNTATNISATADGGGVRANTGPVTITGSTISGNHSNNGGDGGGVWVGLLSGSDSAIRNSQVLNNTAATGFGGGIDATSTFAVEDSTLSGNSADSGGGIRASGLPVRIARTTVSMNHATGGGTDDSVDGGGVYGAAGSITLEDSSVVGNDAQGDSDDFVRSGGIGGVSSMTITGTRISGNTTGGGTLDFGGGIYAAVGNSTIANSTISGNASSVGGGISSALSASGTLSLVHVTMNGNIANTGEAIDPDPDVVTTLRASIIDNGSGACTTSVVSAGYNLDRGSSCGFAPPLDLENVVGPIIGPLLDNGGPTRTQALPTGSPALDRIPVGECDDDDLLPPAGVQAVAEDQRGYPRPFPAGGACDSGSYELFACDGVIQTPPGPFVGCPLPPGSAPGVTQPAKTGAKKCKKRKHKRAAAAKKKCKKKKKR
jgi:predicted outer membrane repeat protein